ncbi:MAG: DUF368 domain-containing protein [Kineosporiaceae bacterium]
MTAAEHDAPRRVPYVAALPAYLAGGALIGTAEVIPGVSGGTIALVVGVYDRLIGGADLVLRGLAELVRPSRGPAEALRHLRLVPWPVIVPVIVGMAVAVVVGASVIEPLREGYPVGARALFLGFIAASVLVPLRMAGGIGNARQLAWVLPPAVAAFLLTGLPPGRVDDPALPVVSMAAAVAICALVLPGVSGSFLLEAVGLYDATISAVNERDGAYLLAFALGAVVGLASFVRVLGWLLTRHRRSTLLIMAGLMIGSLRALWPWQTEDRGLLAPTGGTGDILGVVALVVAGAVGVLTLVAVETVVTRTTERGPVRPADSVG